MRESARRITERMKDYNVRDHTAQVWNHSLEKSHKNFNTTDLKLLIRIFIIINKNLKLPKRCGSSVVDLRLTLNTHEKSVQLKLFS